MRIFAKPSLLTLCGFILGYICVFLPGTRIQYQIINGADTTSQEGFTSIYGDKYGRDVFSCSLARLESMPSPQFVNLLLIWQLVGRILTIMTMSFGVSYAVRNKISHLKFFALTVILMGGPVAIFLAFFNEVQPMCNSSDFYKIISFTPYLPTLILLVIANLLGYFGTRKDSNAIKNISVTST
jgi:hypothetical protein